MANIDSVPSQGARMNILYPNQDMAVYGKEGGQNPFSGQVTQSEQYADLDKRLGAAYKVDISSPQKNDWNDAEVRHMKSVGQIECLTCKERTYQDGSDDPGVSFKAPGHISPESSAAVVGAHEQEHVSRNQASARAEDKKVIAQSVRLFTAICPECGKSYVSGGETRTTTASKANGEQFKAETALGNTVDLLI